MSKHQYDIRISESCVDPNPCKVEGQDPDNFTGFQTRKRCAWEIAAYVFKLLTDHHLEFLSLQEGCTGLSESTLVKMQHCWKSHDTAHIYGPAHEILLLITFALSFCYLSHLR